MKAWLDERLKHGALVVYEENCVQTRVTEEEPIGSAVYDIIVIFGAKD